MQKAPVLPPEKWLRTAATVASALPYMKRFSGATFVIKYGGHAMVDEALAEQFARDIVLLKQVGIHPVVVHGGGPQIGKMLERLQIKSDFVDGLRVTTKEMVEIVEMVLAGSINKQIVSAIQKAGGLAMGLSGKDGNLIKAKKIVKTGRDPQTQQEIIRDLGFVGDPTEVNPAIMEEFAKSHFIPVIAPIGIGEDGETYNINADTAAGAVAAAIKAEKLILLTDVAGVLAKDGELLSELAPDEIAKLMQDGTITGGMIPKLETCVDAVQAGVKCAHILDGRIPHVMLVEIFTEHGAGTMVRE
jgi:acetylglutamate kinase